MKTIFSFLILFFISEISSAQIAFQKTYGGGSFTSGNSAWQTNDGGYIFLGNPNAYLIKTDENGDTLWTKNFGGASYFVGNSVALTNDSGFIITGRFDNNLFLIRTDSIGDTLWTRVFEGSGFIFGMRVKQTTDDGFIILGNTESSGIGASDICLIKTNDIGDTLWTKAYGGTDNDAGYSIEQTNDGGYIITGYSYSFSSSGPSLYLLKTDSLGDLQWSKTLDAYTNNYGNEVHQTSDGGYIIVGNTSTAVTSEVYLIKTDSNGNPLWAKTFGGALNDSGNSVQQTTDGGYIITGFTYSFGAGGNDVYLIKTDANGNVLWTRVFGQMSIDRGLSVQETYDGGYIVGGTLWGNPYLIKTDNTGNSGCNQDSTATITGSPIVQVATPLTITASSNTIITFPSIPVNSGGFVTTFCTTVGISPTPALPGGEGVAIAPNPFHFSTTISLNENFSFSDLTFEIFNVDGKTMRQFPIISHETMINRNGLANGFYFYRLSDKKIVKFIGKLIIQ